MNIFNKIGFNTELCLRIKPVLKKFSTLGFNLTFLFFFNVFSVSDYQYILC